MFEKRHLGEFKLGWVIGNFDPVLFRSKEVEVAIKHFKKGEIEPSHKQLVAKEITIVISGTIRLGYNIYEANDVVTIPPGVYADFESLTDCSLVCIKYPSLPNDKVIE
jgi:quercetin dioxygenase-like cupin family protein